MAKNKERKIKLKGLKKLTMAELTAVRETLLSLSNQISDAISSIDNAVTSASDLLGKKSKKTK